MDESLIITIITGFVATIIIAPYLKRFLEKIGMKAMDIQKKNKPKMATSGGIPIAIGLLTALMAYIFITVFVTNAGTNLTLLFAGLTSVLTITLLITLDDINIQPEQRTNKDEIDTRIGLKQWHKVIISLIAAVPLMAINAGQSLVSIPFVGPVNIGIIYPLIIVPLIIIFSGNATNMLAGMNGLETGLGLVLLTGTGLYSYFYGTIEGAILALTTAACLAGFLKFNKYPASFLPGDTLPYLVGTVFGASIIIGNIEKFALIAFAPWFIEFALKARKKFKASSLGELQKDGTLKPKYKKTYSLTHLAMRLVKREEYITPFLMMIESLFCVAAFIIARMTI
ncbi:MAG: hypothetical protein WC307_02340 [Candidatus Nanoarchaeia archaeon]|jgi:UDP-N-acetylglucosamine--dolichyl-phosphate N-acetylglucosaminephosphotransferase